MSEKMVEGRATCIYVTLQTSRRYRILEVQYFQAFPTEGGVTSNNTHDVTDVTKPPQLRASSSFSGLISYSREGLTPGIRTVFAYSPFALGGGSAPTLAKTFSAASKS